jgi:hypothetical protein
VATIAEQALRARAEVAAAIRRPDVSELASADGQRAARAAALDSDRALLAERERALAEAVGAYEAAERAFGEASARVAAAGRTYRETTHLLELEVYDAQAAELAARKAIAPLAEPVREARGARDAIAARVRALEAELGA